MTESQVIAPMLVLASKSKARRTMLEAAGVTIEALGPEIDEETLKEGLKADGTTARDLAAVLAEAKAVHLSKHMSKHRGPAMVLGGDQVLALEDGMMLDKPVNKQDAKAQLKRMSGKKHRLFSAAVIAEKGYPTWQHVDIAALTMRSLGDDFIGHYVESEWDNIRHCVGCYEIEGRGAQLFSNIQGSQFTIMGLPLLQLLSYLRERGVMPS